MPALHCILPITRAGSTPFIAATSFFACYLRKIRRKTSRLVDSASSQKFRRGAQVGVVHQLLVHPIKVSPIFFRKITVTSQTMPRQNTELQRHICIVHCVHARGIRGDYRLSSLRASPRSDRSPVLDSMTELFS